jgi:predicted RNA binding protein YcfA (HicA-like mRNA interferase family)
MGSVQVLKPREVVAMLERLGFAEIRQRGSHKQFRHADVCRIVPVATCRP